MLLLNLLDLNLRYYVIIFNLLDLNLRYSVVILGVFVLIIMYFVILLGNFVLFFVILPLGVLLLGVVFTSIYNFLLHFIVARISYFHATL